MNDTLVRQYTQAKRQTFCVD